MSSTEHLSPPEYTPEERAALIEFVRKLPKADLQDLLRQIEAPKSGVKSDLRERLLLAFDQGEITYEDVVSFLDSVPRASSQPKLDNRAWYTHVQLAEAFGVDKESLRKRLDRFRRRNQDGWKENEDRRPREPGYFYRVGAVRDILESLRASGQRPAR